MAESRHILIIEDNLDDVELCQRALNKCDEVDYRFSHAKTGDVGLALLQKTQPDCILLDYSLRNSNGLEVLQKIQERYSQLPVLILSGQGSDALAAKLIRAGADDYIVKATIDDTSLHQAISGALQLCQENKKRKPLNVMIVDDNPDDREKCIRSLKKIAYPEYRYTEANGGDAMLEFLAKDGVPDCILLDYSLPGRNGLDLLKELTSEYPFMPVIMMTGQGNERVAVQVIKEGAENYIVKGDIDDESLGKAIADAIKNTALERRLMEKDIALKEEQKKRQELQQAMQLAVEGVSKIDPEGRYTYVNEAYAEKIGYTPDELIGNTWDITVVGEQLAPMQEAYKYMLDNGKVVVETVGLRKNGSTLHKQVTMISDYNDKGEFVGHFCFMQDISERKQAEIALKEATQLNQTILDNAPILMGVMDKDFTFKSMNAYAQRKLQYASEDLLGSKTPYMLHKPEELEQRAKELSAELGKEVKANEVLLARMNMGEFDARKWTYVAKDGSTFPVILSFVPLKNEQGDLIGILGTALDITDRNQAELSLKNAHAFQNLMLANNPDYIFVKDNKFRLVEANDAFKSLYPEEQRDKIIGYTTLESYDEEEADAFLKCDREAFEKGQSETYETIEFPNGEVRTLFTKKVRFEDAEGKPFILGIGRDVTERENMVQQLERSNEELDEFAYIASHDLKEPLRGIHNHTKIVLRECGEHLSEDGVRRMDRVMELTKYMEQLISDLLYFSRLGRSDIAWQDTDINEVVNEVVASTPIIEEEFVEVSIPEILPTIFCDKVRVGEVFRNLIANAVKYNESAQKTIEIGSVRKRLNSKDQTVFYVKDNGIGIDPEFYHEVFRIFKRLHKKGKYGGGTGAGLTFVQKIVDRHHGNVWIESEKEKGATFFFTLPGNENIETQQGSAV